jgi:hypothetical protein
MFFLRRQFSLFAASAISLIIFVYADAAFMIIARFCQHLRMIAYVFFFFCDAIFITPFQPPIIADAAMRARRKITFYVFA